MISKKLLTILICLGLIMVGYLLTGLMPLLAGQFTVFCGAISGLAALQLAGNVGAQVVAAKEATDMHKASVENGVLPDGAPEGQPEGSAGS